MIRKLKNTNKNKDTIENKVAKWSGILFIVIIIYAIIDTIIAKIFYPVVDMEVLDIWYGGINNSGTIIYYAEVRYNYNDEWFSTEVEISDDVAVGDVIKYHIDPDKPWDHNRFIKYTSSKETCVILSIILSIVSIIIIVYEVIYE